MHDQIQLFNRLQEIVTQLLDLPADCIASKNKSAKVITARRIVAYILRDIYGLKVKTIGSLINRDHTSVCSMLNNENHLSLYPALMQRANQVCEMIGKEFPAPPPRVSLPADLEGRKESDTIIELANKVAALERQLKIVEKRVGIIRY